MAAAMMWRILLWTAVTASGAAGLPKSNTADEGNRRLPPLALPVELRVVLAADPAIAAPVALAGGTVVDLRISGAAGATAAWAFAHDGTVLRHGRLAMDNAGEARLRILLPDVRHRVVCEVVLATDGALAWQTLTVYPALPLKDAAQTLRNRRIGVYDPSGRVSRALAAEGLECEDLGPSIARDFFDGDLAILAGVGDGAVFNELCRRFSTRLHGGMDVLVLNPPARWSAWGMRRVDPDSPARGPAVAAPSFGSSVALEDLGAGPWRTLVKSGIGATHLVWPAAVGAVPQDADTKAAVDLSLVVAQEVGRGRVLVSAMPQTERPDTDILGRGLLAQMILWIASPPASGDNAAKGNADD
ncbi:MAG: hypothetical protein NT049_13195 [Planctomycetota bacterium]|nr:hypothetical protein [Planctomycetota bacterium]